MIRALGILLLCQLIGEVLARALGLPVPGPVIGLLILAGGLALSLRTGRLTPSDLETAPIAQVSGVLLASLGLLFVPAGVGVVQHAGAIGAYLGPLVAALVGSTFITLLVTVGVFIAVRRKLDREE